MGSSDAISTPGFDWSAYPTQARDVISRFVTSLGGGAPSEKAEIVRCLEDALQGLSALDPPDHVRASASLRTLADLSAQGWRLAVGEAGVTLGSPMTAEGGAEQEKERIRRQEHLKRDEQLSAPSVRRFVKQMERRRLHDDRFVSIFSLFRDGRELAARLQGARDSSADARARRLREVVDPYLVFFGDEDSCPFTGLRLMDIWRYFRHTWANQYTSVPGRTMLFLVRDRAAADHPVVGIGAVSSPVMQIRERDTWIGWHSETLLESVQRQPSAQIGRWLRRVVDDALSEVYVEDFIEEPGGDLGLTQALLLAPDAELIGRLRARARAAREEHYERPQAGQDLKGSRDWVARARSPLFQSKRAQALADLLEARLVLDRALSARPSKAQVAALAASDEGQRAIQSIAKKAKADRVGIAMADITVCGAVPPYGPLIGGKLVAMLAASPETVDAYRGRYQESVSEIASSMAGREITRQPDLVYLGTTSLYGRSAQYNRISVPAERLGGAPGDSIRYIALGKSAAYGTSHFSAETLQEFTRVLDLPQRDAGDGEVREGPRPRVNYIFGEGVSPKLRKVRDGLGRLGFSAEVLKHHRHRVVYGVPLIANYRDYLLGIDPTPRYLFAPRGAAGTAAVAEWWRERWVSKRIDSDDVLAAVAAHGMTWPIRHGARVPLPPEETNQLNLFEDLDD